MDRVGDVARRTVAGLKIRRASRVARRPRLAASGSRAVSEKVTTLSAMELTSKTVHEVTFRSPKKSGLYVATDVDEFLETIATGLDALHEQLDAQKIRVTELEAQIAENAEQDAAIRKTLVLAQRTADMAIDEAKTESATLRENAAADVKRIREDAERDAASKRSGAEQEAARLIAETQGTLRADVSKLEEARSVLQSDVDALESFLANERQQLRAGLAQTLAALDAGIPLTGMRPAIH